MSVRSVVLTKGDETPAVGLLQIVMFALYGNQYENREEHHLLSMFEVRQSTGQLW